jgi:hypothetical protein
MIQSPKLVGTARILQWLQYRGKLNLSMSITMNPEEIIRQAVSDLPPLLVVALVLGVYRLEDEIRMDPHPRKTNVSGRISYTHTYQHVLWKEIVERLPASDPQKARQVYDELALHSEEHLQQLAGRLRDELEAGSADVTRLP